MGKHFEKGKHEKTKKNNTKIKKILLPMIIVVLVILGSVLINYFKPIGTAKDKDLPNTTVDINNVPDKMEGYNVLGILVIDKLGIEKKILAKTEDSSLNLGVTKFYGPDLNEKGNFCIAGHNYEDVFERANELQLEDTFYIIDKAKSEKVTYQIYEKFSVNPTEVERVLDQETEGRRVVTIITCDPGGYTRLIIKAQENIK